MTTVLWAGVGVVLGAAFVALARRWHPVRMLAAGLVGAALVYVGFAGVGGRWDWLPVELAGVVAYGAFAWLGLRRDARWIGVGWLLHAAWDLGLHLTGVGATFTPHGYTWLCLGFDLLVGGYALVAFWPDGDVPSS